MTEPQPPANPNEGITATPPAPTVASDNITASPPTPVPMPETTPATFSTPVDPSPPQWVWKADYVLLAMLLVLTFFLGSFTAANPDFWMQLAIGERISNGALEFGVDPFSWATEAHGREPAVYWVHHSWLYSWLVYQLHHLLGGAGLVALKALLITGAVALLSRIGWNEANRWFILICLILAALVFSARLGLQPVVVSLAFLAATLYMLHRAGVFALSIQDVAADPRWLWGLPPLFALWANLDHWFILGPIVVGLCWAGTGLSRWFNETGRVPGKTLGLVFGVGLLACVLNPFHVRVFQLPPELAYLVLALTDPIGVPMPAELIAAGRTVKELRKAEMDGGMTMSLLAGAYWTNVNRGWNIAATAILPLFLLGLGAFTLMSLAPQKPEAPSLHVGRFLIWLVFGVMALALYRMVPFFALVAAPLTAMTLGEFLDWQQVSAAVSLERRNRGMNLARVLSIPFMLLLLGLAWPGWLHANQDGYAPRHVAWAVRSDPSLEKAALTLKDLKSKGECGNVFNMSFDFGHYLSWHAPEIKHGLDTRYALFPRQVMNYIKARQTLTQKDRPDADWQDLFEERGIDQVVLMDFVRPNDDSWVKWWQEEYRWRERYGDGKTMVFSWVGRDRRWPVGTVVDDFRRRAFGEVPKSAKPPRQGYTPVAPPTGFWSFLMASGEPVPPEVREVQLLRFRYQASNQLTHPPLLGEFGRDKERRVVPHRHMMLLALGMPATMDAMAPMLALHLNSIRPGDYGESSLPILMVRAARQAVAKNPGDYRTFLALRDANETSRNHENNWGAAYGIGSLRDRMRQLQLVACMYQAAQLQPDEFGLQRDLADIYLNEGLIDLALEQLGSAQKALEAIKATGKHDVRAVDATMKDLRTRIDAVEANVKQRTAQWREMTDGKSLLEKAGIAYGGDFLEVQGENRFRSKLGLAKKSLELLQAIPEGALKEGEDALFLSLRFEILIRMGQAELIAQNLKREDVRRMLPPLFFAHYQLLSGAAVGDYEAADQAMVELEKQFRVRWNDRRRDSAPAILIAPGLSSAVPYASLVASPGMFWFGEIYRQNNELCNAITLRGILALEAGETRKAREHFEAAFEQAGDHTYFNDRVIARRYLELIKAQQR